MEGSKNLESKKKSVHRRFLSTLIGDFIPSVGRAVRDRIGLIVVAVGSSVITAFFGAGRYLVDSFDQININAEVNIQQQAQIESNSELIEAQTQIIAGQQQQINKSEIIIDFITEFFGIDTSK